MTSMAATGWTQEDGQWYYYNNSGDYVYDEWKKSGNSYFYLGDDGSMMTNALIQDGDNYYYVDANGAMVKNQWIQIAADDSEDQDVEYRWYYFGSTGRAYRATNNFSKKTINGKKYAFDSEGKMLFGFVTEDGTMTNEDADPVLQAAYYFGTNEDGAMHTGWLNYTEGLDDAEYDDKDSLWIYYNPSNGEKVVNKEKKVNGYTYLFDENGIMKSDWQQASGSTSNKYFNGDDQGWMEKKSWVWAVPSEQINAEDNENDTYRWFYVGSDGVTVANESKRINGKWYTFNADGIMQSGLVTLSENKISSGKDGAKYESSFDVDDGADADAVYEAAANGAYIYYFGDEETDGAMKTGSSVKVELADDTYTMGFAKTGLAFDGIENNKLYRGGILQTAGDMRYDVKHDTEGNYYVVGSSGTIVKAKSVAKDADDNYYAVEAKGTDSSKPATIYKVSASDDAAKIARYMAKSTKWPQEDGVDKTVELDGEEYTSRADLIAKRAVATYNE